jgi:hypothetical protein
MKPLLQLVPSGVYMSQPNRDYKFHILQQINFKLSHKYMRSIARTPTAVTVVHPYNNCAPYVLASYMDEHTCTYFENYRIVGNFRGVQFSRMPNLQSFHGLIFADACDHVYYTLHNRTYFEGLIFADSCLSTKTVQNRPHEYFPLYGIYPWLK